MTGQASKLTLTSRAFRNDQLAPFYEEVCALTRAHKILPMNSGAEAVESALKLARKWGYTVKGVPEGQAEIIVCADNFHGRTITIVGFSSDPGSREGFGPYAAGFKMVPFGDAAALEAAITPNTVAFLVEPIQGEAGVIIPPPGIFKTARELCTRNNVLFILDEIQTGLGRTGKLLAEEHEGVEADLTLIGKALSGGFYPVSAVLSNSEAMSVLHPGEHGSTFGGNPLACAVARMALKVLVEEGMIENAARIGERLKRNLSGIRSGMVREVRGLRPDAGRGTGPRRGRRPHGCAKNWRRVGSGQGNPRPYHSHRSAPGPDGGPGRLDRGTVRGRPQVTAAPPALAL